MTPAALTDLYTLGNSIDTFAPGHYARVYDAVDTRTNQACAFKVMRVEHLSDDDGQPKWEAMAFINEADLLTKMSTSPHVVRMYDCGYIASTDENPRGGEILTFGLNIEQFRQGAFRYAGQRWRPYLSLEVLPRTSNLLYVMKPNAPGTRWRLPTEEGLDLADQFAEVLAQAHRQRIVYLDHKLEHLYWDGRTLRIIDWNSSRFIESSPNVLIQQITIIDWNSSRFIESSPNVLIQQITQDVHNLCVGILYSLFTGLSPQKGSLVPQPAGQAEVESRYNEIQQLDFGPEPTLSQDLQNLVQRGAQRQIATIDQFTSELYEIAATFGWKTKATLRDDPESSVYQARLKLRNGLAKLRNGQDSIREARDLIREAAILDDINEDFEAELRRLLGKINEMLNGRVIP